MNHQKKVPGMEKKCLALFDFDGTITTKDSFFEFLRYTISTKKLIVGAIQRAPTLLKYRLGLVENGLAKEVIFRYFYAGWEKKIFYDCACTFSLTILPQIIREKALAKIHWHKKHDHEVVIVSASFEAYLKPWCDSHKIQLIGTTIAENRHHITGSFSDQNCSGIEKVSRITRKYTLKEYDYIYAYGDTKGDKEMLSIANEPHFKPFT